MYHTYQKRERQHEFTTHFTAIGAGVWLNDIGTTSVGVSRNANSLHK